MLNRNVPLVVCLGLLSVAAFAQPQGVGYAVEFGGQANGQFQAFPENATAFPTSSLINNGPAAQNTCTAPGGQAPVIPAVPMMVAKPDGTKFYMVGKSGVASFNSSFTTSTNINGLSGTFCGGTISPDGKYLLVSTEQTSSAGTVYVLSTVNDTVVFTEPVGGAVIGMAITQDSNTAYILGESSQTSIVTLNLNGSSGPAQVGSSYGLRDPVTSASLGGGATSFSMSPLGDLYVTAGNAILRIDPVILATCQSNFNCAPTTQLSISATPGPLQYTRVPDANNQLYAYFINQTTLIGERSLYRIPIPLTATSSFQAYVSPEQFDSIYVVGQAGGPQRILAHSPADSSVWDVAPDLSSVSLTSLASVIPATQIYSIAVSGELPTAQYLYAVSGSPTLSDVYLVNLNSNTVVAQAASSAGLGYMQFIYVPSENPAGFTTPLTYNGSQYNGTQTLAANAVSAPLVGIILDQAGNPVYGVPVTFTGDPSLTITPVNTTTNANGYVEATVKVGSSPGSYPVTMTATSASSTITGTFNLVIPGSGTGTGSGGSGGPNLLSIVSGNGQLFETNGFLGRCLADQQACLTVQLVDTNNNPVPNATVNFAVTGPAVGFVTTDPQTTDVNGQAFVLFQPGQPPQGSPFESTTVVATAVSPSGVTLGTVTFVETVYQFNPDGTGEPTVLVQQLSTDTTVIELQGGEGDVIPNAFQATVVSNSFGKAQAIPNIGVRITDPANQANPGAGTCQGDPLSDQNGIIQCNFIPDCAAYLATQLQAPISLPSSHGFTIEIGEFTSFGGNFVTITNGTTQNLSITNGNNQSGSPGQALTQPLAVAVLDNCGNAIPGIPVTWKVTNGSATLSAGTSTTVAGGVAQIKATLGTTPGAVTITASVNPTTSKTFTETVNASVGSLTLISGGGQTALEGAAFAQPLKFMIVDTKGNALQNLPITFSVAGGSASISGTNPALTNPSGQASINVTAGNTPGTVTITATYSTFTATALLTVTAQGPNVTATSFVNAASFQTGLVPCGLATVTGVGLAPTAGEFLTANNLGLGIGPLPYTLGGVTITVNTIPAPILSVSNENNVQQVNFQTPCEVVAGPGTVVVEVGSATTTVPNVTVYPTEPGIFTYAGPSGVSYAAIISQQNGGYLTPSNYAHAGQTYYMVVTGMGQTTPAAVTNNPGNGQAISPSQVVLAIDNIGVPVTAVQYLEGQIGEYLITFTIPTVANGQPFPTGTNLPISLGGTTSAGQTIYDTASVDIPGID